MIVELDKIPVMWATCDKTVGQRREGMLNALRQLGATRPEQIDCPLTQPYYLGLAIGHIKALTRHKPPFLMLEDDARLIPGHEQNRFEVPDYADAIYLGTTTYGRQKKVTVHGSVISSVVNETYIRTYNMLALHAVVYTSQSYVDHVVRLMSRYLANPVGACDDLVADTMHHWRVFCHRKPVFFQNDGKAEQCTTEPILPDFVELPCHQNLP